MYMPGLFVIDSSTWAVEGFTNGTFWNGFECPVFQRCDAVEVMNKCYGEIGVNWFFDEEKDSFVGLLDGNEDQDIWGGLDIALENGS